MSMIPAFPFGKHMGEDTTNGTIMWELTPKVKRSFAETCRSDDRVGGPSSPLGSEMWQISRLRASNIANLCRLKLLNLKTNDPGSAGHPSPVRWFTGTAPFDYGVCRSDSGSGEVEAESAQMSYKLTASYGCCSFFLEMPFGLSDSGPPSCVSARPAAF